jgi:transposase
VRVGLSDTTTHGTRPGQRKTRLLLQVLRDRETDVLRFAHDLQVPPTSNQAERDLRPSKVQQNISGRLTSEARTQDRYTLRGYVSTAAKHGLNAMTSYTMRSPADPGCPRYPHPPNDVPTDHHRTTGRPPADRQQRHALTIRAE